MGREIIRLEELVRTLRLAVPREYEANGNAVKLPAGWYWIEGLGDNDARGWDFASLYEAHHVEEFLKTGRTYEGERVTRAFGPLHEPKVDP
jgi:hypothetical protein